MSKKAISTLFDCEKETEWRDSLDMWLLEQQADPNWMLVTKQ